MKGFWIPVELMELEISWTKRILLAEISQLEMLDKGCIASNRHFAEKLKLTTQAVSKALNELANDCFIIINNAQTKRNFGRTITINFSKSGINFSKSGIHKSGETKENIQSNKTNNIVDDFLNDLKAKVSYKSKVTKTKELTRLIKQLSQNNDLEDIKKAYTKHQEDKKEFAVRITKFLEDYETVYKVAEKKQEFSYNQNGQIVTPSSMFDNYNKGNK